MTFISELHCGDLVAYVTIDLLWAKGCRHPNATLIQYEYENTVFCVLTVIHFIKRLDFVVLFVTQKWLAKHLPNISLGRTHDCMCAYCIHVYRTEDPSDGGPTVTQKGHGESAAIIN